MADVKKLQKNVNILRNEIFIQMLRAKNDKKMELINARTLLFFIDTDLACGETNILRLNNSYQKALNVMYTDFDDEDYHCYW